MDSAPQHDKPRRLTGHDRERFDANGVIAPILVFDDVEIAALWANIARVETERGGRLSAFANAKPHLLLPFLWQVVHDPRVVDCVEDLIGPDIVCMGSSLIQKAPHSSARVAWHQDATYWGLSQPRAVTAWIAVTPSTPESGCVRVVPNTHRQALAHEDSHDPDNMLGARERLMGGVDTTKAIDLVLQPGEMSLHHPLIVHGSDRNMTDVPRIGFAARYLPGDVYQEGGTATLVRGKDVGRVPLEREPRAEFEPDALARHVDIVRRGARVITRQKAQHAAKVAAGSGR